MPGGWYILRTHSDGTTEDLGEGPWVTQTNARDFADAEVGVPWVLFHAPDGTERAFDKERERVYEYNDGDDDPRTDWYVLQVDKRHVVSLTSGPWTESEARRFGSTLRGRWVLFLAPVGSAAAFRRATGHATQATESTRGKTRFQIRQADENHWKATVFPPNGRMFVCDYAPGDGDPEMWNADGSPTLANVIDAWRTDRKAFREV